MLLLFIYPSPFSFFPPLFLLSFPPFFSFFSLFLLSGIHETNSRVEATAYKYCRKRRYLYAVASVWGSCDWGSCDLERYLNLLEVAGSWLAPEAPNTSGWSLLQIPNTECATTVRVWMNPPFTLKEDDLLSYVRKNNKMCYVLDYIWIHI